MILLALALQAAAAEPAAPKPADMPQRFSILAPQSCAPATDKADIVVCADGKSSQALPLPDEAGPPAGRGANRELSAAKVLALEGTPCAATQRGCTVGFGPPIMPLVGALVGAAKSAFAKKPDKRGRVAISLDDVPQTAAVAPVAKP
ncbi:hypothetical protein M9979_10280 [Sphingomonas sp. RP10(2022)]|uniref:Uncharacterized protein n=1 Tax=Sphingomonas liriopis TaxID=2949094 RepID=A0A9X2HPX7_9SPHN|nr:hypothetical protein [Sphingomonas liriopis]MCP3735256.1 hypothetical protein [Sphingomonas liriopis]